MLLVFSLTLRSKKMRSPLLAKRKWPMLIKRKISINSRNHGFYVVRLVWITAAGPI